MTFEQAQEFVVRAEKHGFQVGTNLIAAPEGGYFMRVAREDESPGVLTGTTVGPNGQPEQISLARDGEQVGKPATNNWLIKLVGIRRAREAQTLRAFVEAEIDKADYEAQGAEYIFSGVTFKDSE